MSGVRDTGNTSHVYRIKTPLTHAIQDVGDAAEGGRRQQKSDVITYSVSLHLQHSAGGGKKMWREVSGKGDGGGVCRSLCSPPSNPRFPVKPRMHDQTHLNDLAEAGLLVEAGGGWRGGCVREVGDRSGRSRATSPQITGSSQPPDPSPSVSPPHSLYVSL